MLASAAAPDVLIAYPMVGPNITRLIALVKMYPGTRFSVLIDHPGPTKALSEAVSAAGVEVGVVLDLDVGQHRTGIFPGNAAVELYATAAALPGLRPEGFQLYDGHNHQESRAEREDGVRSALAPVLAMRAEVEGRRPPGPTSRLRRHPDVPGVRNPGRHPRGRVFARHVRAARRRIWGEVPGPSTASSRRRS